jgi:hypothetical protein
MFEEPDSLQKQGSPEEVQLLAIQLPDHPEKS